MLNQLCIDGISCAWSTYNILFVSCSIFWHFVDYFYIYIHNSYWSVDFLMISLSCSDTSIILASRWVQKSFILFYFIWISLWRIAIKPSSEFIWTEATLCRKFQNYQLYLFILYCCVHEKTISSQVNFVSLQIFVLFDVPYMFFFMAYDYS